MNDWEQALGLLALLPREDAEAIYRQAMLFVAGKDEKADPSEQK